MKKHHRFKTRGTAFSMIQYSRWQIASGYLFTGQDTGYQIPAYK